METDFLHILNRGVDKRTVFEDSQDYARFVQGMYVFNSTNAPPLNISRSNANVRHPMSNINDSKKNETRQPLVHIHTWCLMPNHYHLLLTPLSENGLSLFMKRLNMGYSKYFNEKYDRSGALWQGKYKKVHIQNDAHFLYVPHYIHANPLDMSYPEWRNQGIKNTKTMWETLLKYKWSSLRDYMGIKNFPSVIYTNDTKDILGKPVIIKHAMNSLFSDESPIATELSLALE